MLFNTIVTMPVLGLITLRWFPMADELPKNITLTQWCMVFVIDVFFFAVLYDSFFYTLHRLLHVPLLMRRIHCVHHRAKLNGDAFHCHPAEMIVNICPFIIACHMVRMTPTMFILWSSIAFLNSVYTHTRASTLHHVHHRTPTCNFGVAFMIWDRFLNTYRTS